MAKRTLRHLVDGLVYTRQTARQYDHVVVARRSPELIEQRVAKIEAGAVARCQKAGADAADWWSHNQHLVETGTGNFAYFHKDQGGAYLNQRGKHNQVDQWQYDMAQEYLAKYPTKTDAVVAAVQRVAEDVRLEVADARSDKTDWFVTSWHQGVKNAMAAASRLPFYYDKRVERINDGVDFTYTDAQGKAPGGG